MILPRLRTDLFDLVDAALSDRPLPEVVVSDTACLGVVLAAKGYPTDPQHNQPLGELPRVPDIDLDYANVSGDLADLRGAGGRLLMVLAQADNLQVAHDRVYDYLARLNEPECFYRHDIGAKAGLN